jgi:integrative and conjugative element protein (TIGR02256 family)
VQGICWIRKSAFGELLNEARRWPMRETGGALLGHREGELAVVEWVLGPGPVASHGLSHFEPDGPWQQEHGERIYEASGRQVAYLGDWHTHPRGAPTPSRQDRKTARMIANDRGFRAPRPLYAIAGRKWRRWAHRPWRLQMLEWNEGALVEMQLVVLDD